MSAKISIYHLYPEHLNLYGDRGNMLALCRRAEWHGFKAEVIAVEPGGEIDFARCDLLFMGGGQDSDQKNVAADLKKRRADLRAAVDSGMVVFAVCGSYQLLGTSYITTAGEHIGGLEIIEIYTEAGPERLIGNIVIKSHLWDPPLTLAGFENHAGKTYLERSVQPLGMVIKGFGNNGTDKTEGAVYKNVIGTYLHGSLLPKNPWLTDYLLEKALAYREQDFPLGRLDDTLELKAHQAAVRRLAKQRIWPGR